MFDYFPPKRYYFCLFVFLVERSELRAYRAAVVSAVHKLESKVSSDGAPVSAAWLCCLAVQPGCAAAAAAAVFSSTSALIGSPMIKKRRSRKKEKENTAGVQKELPIPFNPSLRIALGSSAAQVETQLWRVMPSF